MYFKKIIVLLLMSTSIAHATMEANLCLRKSQNYVENIGNENKVVDALVEGGSRYRRVAKGNINKTAVYLINPEETNPVMRALEFKVWTNTLKNIASRELELLNLDPLTEIQFTIAKLDFTDQVSIRFKIKTKASENFPKYSRENKWLVRNAPHHLDIYNFRNQVLDLYHNKSQLELLFFSNLIPLKKSMFEKLVSVLNTDVKKLVFVPRKNLGALLRLRSIKGENANLTSAELSALERLVKRKINDKDLHFFVPDNIEILPSGEMETILPFSDAFASFTQARRNGRGRMVLGDEEFAAPVDEIEITNFIQDLAAEGVSTNETGVFTKIASKDTSKNYTQKEQDMFLRYLSNETYWGQTPPTHQSTFLSELAQLEYSIIR